MQRKFSQRSSLLQRSLLATSLYTLAGQEVLPRVCSAPLGGDEGSLLTVDAELQQVHVVIRHGARSPYHSLPNQTNPHQFVCHLEGDDAAFAKRWSNLFKLVDADTAEPLHPQPSLTLDVEADAITCQGGMLLVEGVRQLRAIGEHLRDTYSGLIANLSPADVYARAMLIPRVILSSASLLGGFLLGTQRTESANASLQPLPIHVTANQSMEPMNGLPCASAASFAAEADHSFIYPEEVVETLAHMFGVPNFGPYLQGIDPAVADVAYTSVCDGGKLPCGPGGCIDAQLQERLTRLYDEKWCMQYASERGGAKSSELLMYPLVAEILNHMLQTSERPRFAFYIGRDFVIGPVAAALGFFDCKWPAFGSRIVFELWKMKSSSQKAVRVFFDGVDVTRKVHGCGASGELCPVADFQRGISQLISPWRTHEAACSARAEDSVPMATPCVITS